MLIFTANKTTVCCRKLHESVFLRKTAPFSANFVYKSSHNMGLSPPQNVVRGSGVVSSVHNSSPYFILVLIRSKH